MAKLKGRNISGSRDVKGMQPNWNQYGHEERRVEMRYRVRPLLQSVYTIPPGLCQLSMLLLENRPRSAVPWPSSILEPNLFAVSPPVLSHVDPDSASLPTPSGE